jgi:hypothetical protein
MKKKKELKAPKESPTLNNAMAAFDKIMPLYGEMKAMKKMPIKKKMNKKEINNAKSMG